MDPISFGRIWPETAAVVRRHMDILWPVAAAFMFLPQLLVAWHIGDTLPKDLFTAERMPADAIALALLLLFSIMGQLVIAVIVIRDGTGERTLGQILRGACSLLLPAMAATLMQGIAIGLGLFLLIIPGLFLMARLAPVMPLIAASQPDPLNALRTSWELTEGRTLKIIGMLAVLLLGFLMLSLGVTGLGSAVGVLTTLAAGKPAEGWGIGRWLFETMAAGVSAILGTLYIAFLAVLTRELQANPKAAA